MSPAPETVSPGIDPGEAQMDADGALHRTVDIVNERGLHARASAKFVKAAAAFDAVVRVSRDGQEVDAQSIMGLMMLAAGRGSSIAISAQGPQAAEALEGLCALVSNRFEEER